MQPKFEFTGETKTVMGHTLQRIRALRSFGNVNKGDLGGWLEKEENLSHERNSWVSGNALVFDDAQIFGNARASGNSRVFGYAQIFGNSRASGDAWVYDNARASGNACIYNQNHIYIVPNIGSRNGTTTFFRTADRKIWVNCGCFSGDIDRFAAAVKKTHGENQYAKDYAAAIERAKDWIDLSGEGTE
ncbi:hypothetical protein D3Z48_20535 [Clostridiaceae bacterium]|nr:hypothetical protein [Clostridiaceae bacterium]